MEITSVKVHPTVLLSIVDSFERRKEDSKRVIGTLLGNIHGSCVTVTSCFCVPHTESKEEVAVDMEFARTMTNFHVKTNPNEVIVGWYATGMEISAHSVLIHDYYCRETKNPIHLVMDTDVTGGDMDIRAFITSTVGVPGESKKGSLFQPIKTEIVYYDSERVSIDFMNRETSKVIEAKGVQRETLIKLQSDYDTALEATNHLRSLVDSVKAYVEKARNGDIAMDPKIGRKLMDLMNMVPYVEEKNFSKMLNNNLQDTLMVRMLAEAAKAQVQLNEKLINTSSLVTP